MSRIRVNGTDFLGPRNCRAVENFCEWLNQTYPIKNRIMQIALEPVRKIKVKEGDYVYSAFGMIDFTRSPWTMHVPTKNSLREILDTIAHEWRHGLQRANLTGIEFQSQDQCEDDAENWAVTTVDEWKMQC